MKGSGILLGLLASGALAFGFTPEASAKGCKQIDAQIISSETTTGCTSPVGLCTAGKIDGNHGLNGTTFFTADSTAPGPSTAPDPAATISYDGVVQITTDHGSLSTRETGIFDTSTGNPPGGFFSSFDLIIGGTGKFQGATGDLFIGGKTIAGQFVTTVLTGDLCLP